MNLDMSWDSLMDFMNTLLTQIPLLLCQILPCNYFFLFFWLREYKQKILFNNKEEK